MSTQLELVTMSQGFAQKSSPALPLKVNETKSKLKLKLCRCIFPSRRLGYRNRSRRRRFAPKGPLPTKARGNTKQPKATSVSFVGPYMCRWGSRLYMAYGHIWGTNNKQQYKMKRTKSTCRDFATVIPAKLVLYLRGISGSQSQRSQRPGNSAQHYYTYVYKGTKSLYTIPLTRQQNLQPRKMYIYYQTR